MRIAIVLTPTSDHHLQLASQVGVADVVIRFPGLEYSELADQKARIESFGLRVPVIEGYLPIEDIKLGGPQRDAEIEQMKTLIRNMGRAGIGLLCYNFIAGGDWARTSVDEKGRGGALVTGFDLTALPQAPSSKVDLPSADDLWENLDTFLERILPVAEECGVTLAMHPDDPPIPNFQGFPRIMNSLEGFERLVRLRSSPANGICFCQGTFAEMGVDIPLHHPAPGASHQVRPFQGHPGDKQPLCGDLSRRGTDRHGGSHASLPRHWFRRPHAARPRSSTVGRRSGRGRLHHARPAFCRRLHARVDAGRR